MRGGFNGNELESELTLGAGNDTIEINQSSFPTIYNTTTVTDFNVSEDVIEFDLFLSRYLQNWDGATNPFGSPGYLRLQDDASGNAVLSVDRDGGGDNFVDMITFTGVATASFTGSNFDSPWPPDGSGIPGIVINGTTNNDVLDGTLGGDTINGLDGFDRINGGAGDDSIDGGDGRDTLYGNAGADILIGDEGDDFLDGDEGNDSLYGGIGNDRLFQDTGGGLLDGGDDNDQLYASTRYEYLQLSETLLGGDGDDTIYSVAYSSSDSVDAGIGNDIVRVNTNNGNSTLVFASTITLGAGFDQLVLDQALVANIYNTVTVTDFNILEDTIVLDEYLGGFRLRDWDGATNPFATGHLALVDDGSGNAMLQIDSNGGGDNLVTAITFTGVSAASFTASVFEGAWDPLGSQPAGQTIVGTNNSERLDGDIGSDLIQGLLGNDQLYGGAGNDTLEGGGGADFIRGEIGSDVIEGGTENDNLYGDEGNDSLYGEDGNDYLSQGNGIGLLDGGDGNDRLDASFDFEAVNTSETLIGGIGNDTIRNVGYASGDSVDAGTGDDYIDLRLQPYASGATQVSTITLGTGSDTVEINRFATVSTSGNARITDFDVTEDVVLFDDFLAQRLTGWDGASNPFGAGYARLIDDGSGNALFQVDQNGGGNSFVTMIEFTGVSIDDFTQDNFSIDLATNQGYEPDGSGVNGNVSTGTFLVDDNLTGSIGDDDLSGSGGNDTLNGAEGADLLSGGADSDSLIGGFGDDTMSGGSGTDEFVFAPGGGNDEITDFAVGTDALVLQGGQAISGLTEVDTGGAAGVDSTLVEFSDGSTVLLTSVLGVTDSNDLL